jgi:hypothetical protein
MTVLKEYLEKILQEPPLMLQDRLERLLREYTQEEGTTLQCGMRDFITDLHHISSKLNLDFDFAVQQAEECYFQEVEDDAETKNQA